MADEGLLEKDGGASRSLVARKESRRGAEKPKVTKCLVVTVVTTLLGSCLPGGYNLGVINTPQEIIRHWMKTVVLERYSKKLSTEEEVILWSVVVSIFVVGATLGSSCGTRVADRVGRRAAILLNHLLCFFSALLFLWCKTFSSIEMLIIGRFTTGLYTATDTARPNLLKSKAAIG